MKKHSLISELNIHIKLFTLFLLAIGILSCKSELNDPNPPNTNTGEAKDTLYNGIAISKTWPPTDVNINLYKPMKVPYLENPPAVIPINIGRQLFVDDFLIETSTGLTRKFYNAKKISANPVLKEETALEKTGIPGATPKDGGVWWNETDQEFKMWYEAGWLNTMAYATSKDGVTWTRPDLGNGALNQILPGVAPNSCSVIVDYDAPASERYKMFLRSSNNLVPDNAGFCWVSFDGINWSNMVKTGPCGDRSTMFYNPFRKKYVFSIRSLGVLGESPYGRARYYRETSDFLRGASWTKSDVVFWSNADNLDKPDPVVGIRPELYNLNAVGYESIMLGLYQIFLGPQNDACLAAGIPKTTELKTSFSRDGFHWDRPNRDAFIPATRTAGSWDRGYVQSVGGICNIVGDQLWFYYIGFKGDESMAGQGYGMHSHGATGIAVLRRDGFASMSTSNEGILTTRPVIFKGKYLFVNVDCPNGKLSVDILDEKNNVINNFSAAKCKSVSINSTIQQIEWEGIDDLSSLVGKKVKFRFNIKNGDLYAFWVSPSAKGESKGFVGGGGPGYPTSVDNQGINAYNEAKNYTPLN